MKLYRNRAWLRNEYVVKRKPAKQIAQEQETTEMTITRWLTKFGLIRNPRNLKRR